MTAPQLTILIFEDAGGVGLSPLLRLRPAFELRSGIFSLRERCELLGLPLRAQPQARVRALVAEALPELLAPLPAQRVLAVNARLLASLPQLHELLERAAREDFALQGAGALLAAAGANFDPTPRGESSSLGLLEFPWQLAHGGGKQIEIDFPTLLQQPEFRWRSVALRPQADASYARELAVPLLPGQARIEPGVHILGSERVLLGDGVRLAPGVVLDASGGPIVIGAGSQLAAHVSVLGPSFIGPGCRINPGARLREGTILGALCRIGGEVEASVVLDASNKQHEGFLGHAVLGSWVNLGAATNVSDLKNNYGSVRVDFGHGAFDSGERFVGPTIADHSKTAIGTLLGTGCVVDVACNVLGPGFPPRYLPPFSWGGAAGFTRADLQKTLATAQIVCSRRQAEFTPAMREILMRVHREL